jgi:hypothetical protein
MRLGSELSTLLLLWSADLETLVIGEVEMLDEPATNQADLNG